VKNFLKPDRHTHKDPKVRIASLSSLDNDKPESQVVIEKMASSDDDESVRLAAIDKLHSVSALQRVMAAQSDSSSVSGAIDTRIVSLLSNNSVTQAEADALLESQASVYAPLMAINSADESIRLRSLDRLDNESMHVAVLEQTRFHDVRLQCAQKLTQEKDIKLGLVACRSKDKVVAKLLQSRLDEKAEAEAQHKAQTESIASTLSAMQGLSQSVWSPQYAGRMAALSAKWETLDSTLRANSQAQFEKAHNDAQAIVAEHDKKAQQEQDAKSQADAKAVQANDNATVAGGNKQSASVDTESQPASTSNDNASGTGTNSPAVTNTQVAKVVVAKPDPARDALLQKLAGKTLVELEHEGLEKLKIDESVEAGSDSEKLIAHAQSIGVLFNPPFELSKGRPGAITERTKRVKALLNTESLLPGVQFDQCVYIGELKKHADALESRLEKAKQESVDRAKATHRQFGALSATITDGKWGPASSMFRRLQKKVDSMEPAERKQFSDKMSRAEKQLAEMADWQDFAARPKLEALCDSIEALPAKELSPEALAKEIKSMQAQWKELGASRASNELWTRFKTAGDVAYEPCKEHFAKKQEERDTKLKAKVALCDQLEQQFKEVDWETADYKAVQRSVFNAKRDWSRNRVTDRKPDRALEQRFSDVLKPLEQKLGEQYEANVNEKRELIEKIKKLAESEINQHSANQAKKLQSAWKQVGIVPRKDDQALWEEFNGHARAIHKHQHDAQREKYQASMSHVFRARDIIKELRKIAKSSDADDTQVQTLQAEFQALEEFPEKDKKFLLRDFRGALDACSRVQENASKKRAQAETNEINRLVELCEQLEAAVESPDSASDTLRDDVGHAWENASASVSREALVKLSKRRDVALKHLEAGTQYDYDANETLRRQLLIQLEILADKETPAEDKALRMQYQLENLREGMTSSAVTDKRAELSKLVAQWHAAPPASTRVKDSLHSRYLAATNQ